MFAILFEVLLIEIQEEIHHFAGWEGGGSRGTKIVNKNFMNKLAFPNSRESSRDFSSEKTPFVMTPFAGPDLTQNCTKLAQCHLPVVKKIRAFCPA